MSKCNSVSAGELICDKEDSYSAHMTLTHRNEEAGREWYLDQTDKTRWGITKKNRKVADEGAETVPAGSSGGDPVRLEHGTETIGDLPGDISGEDSDYVGDSPETQGDESE